MALPQLSPEQRRQAQEKAIAARQARAELLNQVKTGAITLDAVLERGQTNEIVKKTKVADVLKALPGYGPVKVRHLLEQAQIPVNRKVGGLGHRQRDALLKELG